VTMLIDTNQHVAARYIYDPFGRTLSKSGPLADVNRYQFSSKPLHDRSGLYDYLYRWYAPEIQRWVNRDPIGEKGGMNLYKFADNSPTSNYDAWGFSCSDEAAEAFHNCMNCGADTLHEIGQAISRARDAILGGCRGGLGMTIICISAAILLRNLAAIAGAGAGGYALGCAVNASVAQTACEIRESVENGRGVPPILISPPWAF